MSDLSSVQFAGVEAINESRGGRGGGGGGLLNSLELGIDHSGEKPKIKLQPAGTNQYKLYEHLNPSGGAASKVAKIAKVAAVL